MQDVCKQCLSRSMAGRPGVLGPARWLSPKGGLRSASWAIQYGNADGWDTYLDGRCSCQRECQVALAPESANVTPIHEQDLSISVFSRCGVMVGGIERSL